MGARGLAVAGVVMTIVPWALIYLVTWLFSGVNFLNDDHRPDLPWWIHILFLTALAVPVAGTVGARLVDQDRGRSRVWLITATAGSGIMTVGTMIFGLPIFIPATILFILALTKTGGTAKT